MTSFQSVLTECQRDSFREKVLLKLEELKKLAKEKGLIERLKICEYYVPYSQNKRLDFFLRQVASTYTT
jgi:hypothetical protein